MFSNASMVTVLLRGNFAALASTFLSASPRSEETFLIFLILGSGFAQSETSSVSSAQSKRGNQHGPGGFWLRAGVNIASHFERSKAVGF